MRGLIETGNDRLRFLRTALCPEPPEKNATGRRLSRSDQLNQSSRSTYINSGASP